MNRLSLNAFCSLGLTALCGLATAGCGGDDDETPAAKAHIEIKGTWGNADFGETDVIDDTSWSSDFGTGATVSTIVEFSNTERYAVRLSPDGGNLPGTYDYTVWTAVEGDAFYTCTANYGCPSADAAEAGDGDDTNGLCDAPAPDESDVSNPDGTGCSGYPWTKLTKQ